MCNNTLGFLAINKPLGLTSHDCVSRIRKIYKTRRVGHGGTLDPGVTGVLPIAIGKATRLLPFLKASKTYVGIIQLGIRTNTNDLEGEIISKGSWPKLNIDSLENCLNTFEGVIEQSPPIFSNVHIAGERAHRKARKGETFDLPPKRITIHKLQILNWDNGNGTINIKVHCSPGTYIRSLARDIGEKLCCGAALAKLHRTESSGFHINDAISLPYINTYGKYIKPNLINPLRILNHLPNMKLTDEESSSWRNGKTIRIARDRFNYSLDPPKEGVIPKEDSVLILNNEDKLVGLAKFNQELLIIQPKIVFNAIS